MREAIRRTHPDLDDIVEELLPFTASNMESLTTVVDDEDLK
jgi:hypothetical protein